jgi:hypothetical protein
MWGARCGSVHHGNAGKGSALVVDVAKGEVIHVPCRFGLVHQTVDDDRNAVNALWQVRHIIGRRVQTGPAGRSQTLYQTGNERGMNVIGSDNAALTIRG